MTNLHKDLTPETIRQHLFEYNKKYYRKTQQQATRGTQPYSAYEDDLIIKHVMPDRLLAGKIGRSQKAIQQRRLVLRRQNSKLKPVLKFHRYTQNEIKRLCAPGADLQKLSSEFGISYRAAANMRYKYRKSR